MRVHTDWLLTPERAAIHVPTATAVIADLHLGYDQARRRSGEAVPTTCLGEALATLAALLADHVVHRLVIAGDLVENSSGADQVAELAKRLQTVGVELAGWVPGNHDKGLSTSESPILLFPGGVNVGGWRVVHGDGALPSKPRILGHFHPCLRWRDSIAAPCYLIGSGELVLPAFSVDAAGVNVLRVRRWRNHRCAVIAGREVLDFGELAGLQKAASPGRAPRSRPPRARN